MYTAYSTSVMRPAIQYGDIKEYMAEVVLVLEDRRWLEGGEDEGVREGEKRNVLMELINAASSLIPVRVQYDELHTCI